MAAFGHYNYLPRHARLARESLLDIAPNPTQTACGVLNRSNAEYEMSHQKGIFVDQHRDSRKEEEQTICRAQRGSGAQRARSHFSEDEVFHQPPSSTVDQIKIT